MSSALVEERVDRFQGMLASAERVGVSEFARSKDWRDRLPIDGCFEVIDRAGIVGYMLDPAYARALNDKILDLESQLERSQIAAMFQTRANRVDVKTGDGLTGDALSYFDAHADELTGIIDGGQ